MTRASPTADLRIRYRFDLDDDDSGGPTGPDYLVVTMTPNKEDLKTRIAKEMHLTIYLNEGTTATSGEEIVRLLKAHVAWLRVTLPKN